MGEQFEIGALHCETCKGLHITRPMLNTLLLSVAKQVREINIERIVKVATEQVVQQKKQWRFCPVCRKSGGMQFNKFLAQMPVMIDECEDHGIWFDNGELRLVIEWAESGGMQILKRQLDAEVPKVAPRTSKSRPKPEPMLASPQPYEPPPAQGFWMFIFLSAAAAGYFFLGLMFVALVESSILFSVVGFFLWPLCWWLSAYAGAKANQNENYSFSTGMIWSFFTILFIGLAPLAMLLPFIFVPVIILLIWIGGEITGEK
ncbi:MULTISPECIES: TFIIB-type zinc ribbon-containing protein [Deefgea]|uniref:Transcription factor zinc-finger domain-containing protein n=1 Tax=Deefgea chitinilytica TaxID=570276 RepID=A0ABS2CFJ1_9NEIS|nr:MULTISPECIES: zf-TFIIB domain-containing protein [Deefgea]MBM5572919.1 hypothetical protein [Deefgea chitinilytica]MBM9890155.1 zf-TFIIB domain-containing protein [Deefgea sp. CFH1-16]